MIDYKAMLNEAFEKGTKLEDVLADIQKAADEIKREDERAARAKYDIYNQVLDMRGNVFAARVLSKTITLDDAAIIVAHFMGQNIPGYTEYCAMNDINPADEAKTILSTQLALNGSKAANRNKSEEEQGTAFLETAFAELGRVLKDSWDKAAEECAKERELFAHPAVQEKHDAIADFFKQYGL